MRRQVNWTDSEDLCFKITKLIRHPHDIGATHSGPELSLSGYSYELLLESRENPLEGDGALGGGLHGNQHEQQLDADSAYALQLQSKARGLQELFIQDIGDLQELRLKKILWKKVNNGILLLARSS